QPAYWYADAAAADAARVGRFADSGLMGRNACGARAGAGRSGERGKREACDSIVVARAARASAMARSWLRELRRRHVFRVAAGYAVVGWLLIQIATQVFPFFRIPDWSVRLLVLLVLAGFPVALVLAWAFDATPHGIVRTESEGQPVLRRGSYGTLVVGMVGLAIAIVLGAAYWWSHRGAGASVQTAPQVATASNASKMPAAAERADATGTLALPQTMAGLVPVEPKSIAVLPFENRSADPDNRYFAEGMQDMILTKLAD